MSAARNKQKGSEGEREIVILFRELGFDKCITSRMGSRFHDDAGIDLINIPFNVQVKKGKYRGLNPRTEISYTKERVKELFPEDAPEQERPTILFHLGEVGRGKKKSEITDLVFITINDFKKLWRYLEEQKKK